MISLQIPLCTSIPTFAPQFWHLVKPPKNGQLWRPKKGIKGPKKRHFPNPYWFGLFAKKRIQIAQIWPLWRHLHFTAAYMGSPPCTLSQHPNIKETGYSNVLGTWVRSDMCRCLYLCYRRSVNVQHIVPVQCAVQLLQCKCYSAIVAVQLLQWNCCSAIFSVYQRVDNWPHLCW